MSRDSRYFLERILPDIAICWGVPAFVFGSTWWIATDRLDNPVMCIGLALLTTSCFTWWVLRWWFDRKREEWCDKRGRTVHAPPRRAVFHMRRPAWPERLVSQLVTHIPHRMRMGLALILGPVSLAIGISLWWPMMATAEFRYNYVEIQTWYLESLAANFVGIALLRYWVVEWRKSRRQAPDRGEPEPRQPCSNCNHGHLIPVSVALLPPFSVIGYLLIGMVLWQSAAFAPRCFWPGGSGSIFHDRRNADLLYLALMLLVGWFLRLRTTVLICDNCHCRNYPRPPGLDRTPSPEEDDEPTEDE